VAGSALAQIVGTWADPPEEVKAGIVVMFGDARRKAECPVAYQETVRDMKHEHQGITA